MTEERFYDMHVPKGARVEESRNSEVHMRDIMAGSRVSLMPLIKA